MMCTFPRSPICWTTYGLLIVPDSAVAHADLLMRISSAQLLVLDDLGAERNTPFAEDKLFQIVNHRYEERLPTIITTSDRLSRH